MRTQETAASLSDVALSLSPRRDPPNPRTKKVTPPRPGRSG
jgi:hypothetical protein